MRAHSIAIPGLLAVGIAAGPTMVGAQTTPILVPMRNPTTIAVNTGPGDQYDAHVSGLAGHPYVVYRDNTAGIRYLDVVSGSDVVVPNTTGLIVVDSRPRISGTTMMFERGSNTNLGILTEIWDYDISTGSGAPLAQSSPTERFPEIGGRTVAWESHFWYSLGIVAYDLGANASQQLTVSNSSQIDLLPAVSPDGNVVVWTKCVGSSAPASVLCSAWQAMKVGNTWGTPTQASAVAQMGMLAPVLQFVTNGEVIVNALTNAGGGLDLVWRPVGGGTESRLSFAGGGGFPRVSGHIIAFELSDGSQTDIYAYDYVRNRLYQVTNTPTVNEVLPDVFVDPDGVTTVAYEAHESDINVYATMFNPYVAAFSNPTSFHVHMLGPGVANVNFDRTACGAPIGATMPVAASTRYADLGVTFSAGKIFQSPFSASVPNLLAGEANITWAKTHLGIPPVIDGTFEGFVQGIGFTNIGASAHLDIADAAGNVFGSADTDPKAPGFLGIVSTAPIASFHILGAGIDDLVFTSIVTPNCAPTVHVPADIVVTTDPLQSTAVVTFAVTAMAVDGSAAAVSCSPPSGSAFPIGTTTVSCVGTDAYGNVGTASFTVTVHGIVQLIAIDISQIQSFTLAKPGITISFDVKLQAILATARAGNITAACSELQAFINEVNAQTQPPASKPLTPAQASQLLAAANQIKTVLGCP